MNIVKNDEVNAMILTDIISSGKSSFITKILADSIAEARKSAKTGKKPGKRARKK